MDDGRDDAIQVTLCVNVCEFQCRIGVGSFGQAARLKELCRNNSILFPKDTRRHDLARLSEVVKTLTDLD